MEELNKWVVMLMLQDRGCVSYDKWNYEMMEPRLETQLTIFGEAHTFVVVRFDGSGFSERMPYEEYKIQLRDHKIDKVIG